MANNIVFYFSGTGNSLHIAQKIAETLGNCSIQHMGAGAPSVLPTAYDSIGFVLPTYFQGVPLAVYRFLKALNLKNQQNAYIYAVTTYGAFSPNTLEMVAELLQAAGGTLHYGAKLKMFSNYIVLYNMAKNPQQKAENALAAFAPILHNIKNRHTNTTRKPGRFLLWYYNTICKRVPEMDKHFRVAKACIGCGICKEVCPAGNIVLQSGKPVFQHQCEQCMACIQCCPQQAINYKNKTQKRRRYTHPQIPYSVLAKRDKQPIQTQ